MLYAATLGKTTLFDEKRLEDLLPTLKSGFYYLWLPQLEKD
ncbi:MAG: hypothetical protein WCC06_06220 [Candidatus Aminicenantales bacterium]